MSQIFISYTPSDKTFARTLTNDLEQNGARVWLDIHHAQPGAEWDSSVEEAFSTSDILLVILSPEAVTSAYVNSEWQAYLAAYRPVIPVMVRRCDPPEPLRTRRPINFTRERNYPRAFHHLMARLLDCAAKSRRSDPIIWTMAEDVQGYKDYRRREHFSPPAETQEK